MVSACRSLVCCLNHFIIFFQSLRCFSCPLCPLCQFFVIALSSIQLSSVPLQKNNHPHLLFSHLSSIAVHFRH
uniref:Uncharacterized protein n=1 Tax=Kalanchoe fedtschenkoi TaxID=63787 RepID=A0A7N0TSQ3_KALFE